MCIVREGGSASSSTFSTEGPHPASTASAGSAHVVADGSVLALAAVLAVRAKASLGASCSGESKPDDGLILEQTTDQWGIFRYMGILTICKRRIKAYR